MYFKSSDLSKMFNVSPLTIKREYERKKLHGFYVRNELRFSQQDIDDYTCLRKHHKTLREIELEKEIEDLKNELIQKKKVINSIKFQILEAEKGEFIWKL